MVEDSNQESCTRTVASQIDWRPSITSKTNESVIAPLTEEPEQLQTEEPEPELQLYEPEQLQTCEPEQLQTEEPEPELHHLADKYLIIVQRLGVNAEDRLSEWKEVYAVSPLQAVLAIISMCRKVSRGTVRDPNAFFTACLRLAKRRSSDTISVSSGPA